MNVKAMRIAKEEPTRREMGRFARARVLGFSLEGEFGEAVICVFRSREWMEWMVSVSCNRH